MESGKQDDAVQIDPQPNGTTGSKRRVIRVGDVILSESTQPYTEQIQAERQHRQLTSGERRKKNITATREVHGHTRAANASLRSHNSGR